LGRHCHHRVRRSATHQGISNAQVTINIHPDTDLVTGARPRPRRHSVPGRTHYDEAMTTSRRTFAALTALLAIALFAPGCSSKSAEPLPDAAGLLKQSIATTKALTSAHLEIAVNGKIDGLMVKTLSGDLTNVPAVAIKGNSTIAMGGSDVDIQLVVLDGTLYAALTPNSWLDMGPAVEVYDPSLILNPDAGLANMLTAITDAKSQDFETIGGVETVKIAGKVGADAVNKLIPQLKAGGPISATVWIEKDAPNQLVQAEIDQSEGNTVQLTLSEWDKPVTVTKPAM
jgi:lipoprotein LprG